MARSKPALNLQGLTSSQEIILSMSKLQYLAHTSLTREPFSKLTVGAAILSFPNPGFRNKPRILLLKRNPSETYYASVFEMPGGKVDDTDSSILTTIVREVKEETGLDIMRVFGQLPDFTYLTSKVASGTDGKEKTISKTCLQLSFAVTVAWEEVRVNAKKHSMGVWADREMVTVLEMTEEMRALVEGALERAGAIWAGIREFR